MGLFSTKVRSSAASGNVSKFLQKVDYYKGMKGMNVKAGWDARTRNADGNYPCEYMKVNEYGSRTIPPRPAMRMTSQKNRAEWQRMLKVGMEKMVTQIQLGHMIGSRMRSDIQGTIVSNVPPPNAPSTIRAKERVHRSNGGTLRASLFAYENVRHVVVINGKEVV